MKPNLSMHSIYSHVAVFFLLHFFLCIRRNTHDIQHTHFCRWENQYYIDDDLLKKNYLKKIINLKFCVCVSVWVCVMMLWIKMTLKKEVKKFIQLVVYTKIKSTDVCTQKKKKVKLYKNFKQKNIYKLIALSRSERMIHFCSFCPFLYFLHTFATYKETLLWNNLEEVKELRFRNGNFHLQPNNFYITKL